MLNKHFAIIAAVIFLLLVFRPNVVKAQQDEVPYTIDVNLQPQVPPGTSEVVMNNYGDEKSVKTEIDIWEADLGKQATDGSYIGPLSEASVFEVDFTPLDENQPYTTSLSDNLYSWYLNPMFDWRYQWPEGTNFWSDIPTHQSDINYEEDFIYNFPSFPIAKTRSIVSVTQIVNFSNRVIMSGATEFWVKIPVQSSCINWNELVPVITLTSLARGEVFDQTKLWLSGKHQITYSPIPSYTNWVEYINNDTALYPSTTGMILKEYSSYEQIKINYNGRLSQIAQSITEKYVIGESVYAKIYGVVEPNVNYIVTFSAIMNSKPKILITEENLFITTLNETVTPDRQSFIQISDIDFIQSDIRYYDSSIYEYIRPVVEVTTSYFGPGMGSVPPLNSSTELPIDMAFSFVFLSGRGDCGMYGQHFNLKPNDSLVFYKTITPTSNQYISVMIPFISEKAIKINAEVEFMVPGESYTAGLYNRFELQGELYHELLFTGENYTINYKFGYKAPYWWQSETSVSYSDYILFTVPYKVDTTYSTSPKYIRIMITFVEEANLTFMFSTINPSDLYSQLPFNSNRMFDLSFSSSLQTTDAILLPTTRIRSAITYIYQDTQLQPIFYGCWDHKEDYGYDEPSNQSMSQKYYISNINEYEMIHSELFCSVQMTDGMWHQLTTNANGFQYATNFFERRMAVGIIEYWVDTTNRSTETTNHWYDDGTGHFRMAWEAFTKGDIIGAVKNVIAGAVSLIWNGLKAFLGWIYGIFVYVWNLLCKVGQFIKTVLTNFIDTIMSIIDDIVGNAEKILNIAIYAVSIIIFAYVVSWIGRFIYITKRGLNA